MTKCYWVSGPSPFTGKGYCAFTIEIDEAGIIVRTSPIAYQWRGKFLDDFISGWKPEKMEEMI